MSLIPGVSTSSKRRRERAGLDDVLEEAVVLGRCVVVGLERALREAGEALALEALPALVAAVEVRAGVISGAHEDDGARGRGDAGGQGLDADQRVEEGALALLDLAEDRGADLRVVEAAAGVLADRGGEIGQTQAGRDLAEAIGAAEQKLSGGLRGFGHSSPNLPGEPRVAAGERPGIGERFLDLADLAEELLVDRVFGLGGLVLVGADLLGGRRRWLLGGVGLLLALLLGLLLAAQGLLLHVQLLDARGDHPVLPFLIGEAEAGHDAGVVEVLEGLDAGGRGGEVGVPGDARIGVSAQGLEGGGERADRQETGAVGREDRDARPRAEQGADEAAAALASVRHEMGSEDRAVVAVQVAEVRPEEERALHRGEGHEALEVDDQPVAAAFGGADRGEDRPLVVRRAGAEQAEAGQRGAQELEQPDELLHDVGGRGSVGGLQDGGAQIVGQGVPAAIDRAHHRLTEGRVVEPCGAAQVDAIGVGLAREVLLVGEDLAPLHVLSEVDGGLAHPGEHSPGGCRI